jgi:histidine triad (HIT) family protein
MRTPKCIFCKIIAGEIPSSIILETETIVVIKDLHPKAPIHYLIIPKKHISDIQALHNDDLSIAIDIFQVAQQLSSTLSGSQAFRLVSNNGADIGQIIFHIHIHFLAGKTMSSDV